MAAGSSQSPLVLKQTVNDEETHETCVSQSHSQLSLAVAMVLSGVWSGLVQVPGTRVHVTETCE